MTKTCYLVSRAPDRRPPYPVMAFLDRKKAESYRDIQSSLSGDYWRIDTIDVDLEESN